MRREFSVEYAERKLALTDNLVDTPASKLMRRFNPSLE
jgi:hypothetical protein